jgi:hypothetical protein
MQLNGVMLNTSLAGIYLVPNKVRKFMSTLINVTESF